MTSTAKCSHYCHMLSDFIDGELSPEFCSLLEKHLQNCENCRIVLNTLQKTIYIYQQADEPVKIPADVKERLFTSLSLDEYFKR